jgi:hypothetical protein
MLRKILKLFLHPPILCSHTYCYRDRHCTKCAEYKSGPEPIYTPHLHEGICPNCRLIPAKEINGKLIPI